MIPTEYSLTDDIICVGYIVDPKDVPWINQDHPDAKPVMALDRDGFLSFRCDLEGDDPQYDVPISDFDINMKGKMDTIYGTDGKSMMFRFEFIEPKMCGVKRFKGSTRHGILHCR